MLKNQKIFLIFLVLAIGISACGIQSTTETLLPANEDSVTTEASTEAETAAQSEAETISSSVSYLVVETGQGLCYKTTDENIPCPAEGEAFYGQDAQYTGSEFAFQNNGDGTVTDLNTGLMWQVMPSPQSFSYEEAVEYAENLELAGYDDWRLPSTKELFSISDFSKGWPYLDTDIFDIAGNSVSKDEQYWTEHYVGLTHGGNVSAFGVNQGTGHIKSYPIDGRGNYVRVVRGEIYGINDFVNNGDGTVTDLATGLMWSQDDSGVGMDWEDALAYAEGSELAGYDDWRLPNVKELQSILDYSKSPNAIDSDDLGPAIDIDFFNITTLASGTTAYDPDYGYFWTSTSAYQNARNPGYYYAWYVAFGTAPGPDGNDTHGAGAVRFAGKAEGGPDGEDAATIFNYVRLVRGGNFTETPNGNPNANNVGAESPSSDGTSAPQGTPGRTEDRGQGEEPDFTAAAEMLGITEEELMAALGDVGQARPNFAAAAEILGITEEELMEALGISVGGPPNGGGQPPNNGG